MYNLSTGDVCEIKTKHWLASDHGTLTGVLPSGEKLSGEYSIVRGGAVGWGAIYGSVYASSSVAAISLRGQGSAILRGDKGTLLNCEFISSGHGSGACEDNHGIKYKLMF